MGQTGQDRMSEGASREAALASLDVAALGDFYAAVSHENGIEIAHLLTQLKALFSRPRTAADLQAYREGKKPWKKLVDEVVPVARLLKHLGTEGRVRFPLDDQPPDAWLWEAGTAEPTGIEVTRVLGRSKMELAKDLRERAIGRGFLGLPDHTPQNVFDKARARSRVTNVRSAIEQAIEDSARERLKAKSESKFDGQTLLLLAPLGSLPDHDWTDVLERLALEAQGTAFHRVVLMDDTRPSQAPLQILPLS